MLLLYGQSEASEHHCPVALKPESYGTHQVWAPAGKQALAKPMLGSLYTLVPSQPGNGVALATKLELAHHSTNQSYNR